MFGANSGSTGFSFGQSTPQQQQQGQQAGGTSLFGQTPSFGGFGASTGTPAFGQQGAAGAPAGGTSSLFGGGAQQGQTTSAFGGFGSSSTGTTPAFGQTPSRPAFGSTGGVFGGGATSTAPSTGGLFGSTSAAPSAFGQPATTTSAFGQPQNAATSLFGRSQPTTTGFGLSGSTTPGSGLFGGGSSTNTATTTSAFGQSTATGNMNQQAPTAGTSQPAYQATSERDPTTNTVQNFQSITCMPAYKNFSFEELRLMDYQQGRKVANATGTSGVFGASTSFGTSNPTNSLATPFGQSNASTGFGQTTGGQQTSTGLFGQTSSQPSTGLFGQASSTPFGGNTTSAFGQPAQQQPNAFGGSGGTGLFGQNTQQPTGGLFGSTQQQPAAGGGLFGSGQQATSNPFGQSTNSTTTSLFGQNQQNKPAGFGGFGQTNTTAPAFGQPASSNAGFGTSTPAPSGGLFGQTSSAPASGFSFGQSNTQTPGGGLFGNNTNKSTDLFGPSPATNAPLGGLGTGSGSLFGQNNQQPAAGANNQSKPLFGGFGSSAPAQNSTPASTSFGGFGQTATSAAGGTGGLFGTATSMAPSNPSTNTGGGLFGQSGQQNQGQTGFGLGGGGAGGLGGSGGLFGRPNQTPAPGGFGQTTSQPSMGGGLFGTPAAAPSLFSSASKPAGGNSFGGLNGFTQSPQNQPTMQATVDQNAYGQNPLFNSNQGPTLAVPIEQAPSKTAILPLINNRIGTPRSTARLRPRNLMASAASAATEGPVPWLLSGSKPASPYTGAGAGTNGSQSDRPANLFSGLSKDSVLGANAFSPRTSVKKLIINRKVKDVDIANGTGSPRADSPFASHNGKLAPSALKARVNFDSTIEPSDTFGSTISNVGSPLATRSTNKSLGTEPSTPSPASAKFGTPVSNKMAPAVQKGQDERSNGREKGNYWIEPSPEELAELDTEQLSNVEDFVVAREGYGKIAWKMPVDLNGLNPADIPGQVVQIDERMTAVYEDDPRKPARGEGLNVPARITLEACWPLDKATREPIKDESHPKVRHHITKLKTMNGTRFVSYDVESGQWTFDVEHFSRYGLADSDDDDDDAGDRGKQVSAESPRERGGKGRVERAPKPSLPSFRTLKVINRALQKSSDQGPMSPFGAVPAPHSRSPSAAKGDTRVVEEAKSGQKVAPAKKVRIEIRRKHVLPEYAGIDSKSSITRGRNKSQIDSAMFQGRSFRTGWGPGLLIVKPDAAGHGNMAKLHAGKVALQSQDGWRETEALLNVQKAHTKIQVVDGIPQSTTLPTLRFHHFQAASEASVFANLPIWTLAKALFDEVDMSLPKDAPTSLVTRVNDCERRQRLSEWLVKAVSASSTDDMNTSAGRGDHFGGLFALLSGNRLEDAIEMAMNQKNYRLATLIGQGSTDEDAKNLLKDQLSIWRELRVEPHIEPGLRKIFYLLSGETGLVKGVKGPDPVSNTSNLHIATGLDWKRAFGLFMWYAAAADDPIETILSRYEEAYSADTRICPPTSLYTTARMDITEETGVVRNDIAYELIKLYSDPLRPLEQTLHPRNMGISLFDSTIGWHLQQVFMRSLKSRHFHSKDVADRLTWSVSAVLEREGHLQWAIFVLLHLENPRTIEKAVRGMIIRHVEELAGNTALQQALVTDLLIPKTWLAFALALRARSLNCVEEELEHLIDAEEYEEVHLAIIFSYAPESLLDGNTSLLEKYLTILENVAVSDWQKGGQIYQIFLAIRKGGGADANELRAFLRLLPILNIPQTLRGRAVLAYMASQAGLLLHKMEHMGGMRDTGNYGETNQVGIPDQDILALERERAMILFEASLA